jgi:ribonuclease HI
VKGHNGHAANEAADRLAVLSRRNEEFKVPSHMRTRMLQTASEDIFDQMAAA